MELRGGTSMASTSSRLIPSLMRAKFDFNSDWRGHATSAATIPATASPTSHPRYRFHRFMPPVYPPTGVGTKGLATEPRDEGSFRLRGALTLLQGSERC